VGSDAICEYWQRGAGAKREIAARMGRPMTTQDRVAVAWRTTVIGPGEGEITLPGCLLLRFAPDGRCRDLREYWQVEPGRREPPGNWGT
jgi:SnoaL-like domain